jgi:hypothetical protein
MHKRVRRPAREDLVPAEDWNHAVAAPGAGHFGRALSGKRLKQFRRPVKATDIPGADPRRGLARKFPSEMVIEGHRPPQFRDRNSEGSGNGAHRAFAEVAVTIMEGVEQGKKRRGLSLPAVDKFLVGFGGFRHDG